MTDRLKTKLYLLFNVTTLVAIAGLILLEPLKTKGLDIRYVIAGGNALLLLAQIVEYRKMCRDTTP